MLDEETDEQHRENLVIHEDEAALFDANDRAGIESEINNIWFTRFCRQMVRLEAAAVAKELCEHANAIERLQHDMREFKYAVEQLLQRLRDVQKQQPSDAALLQRYQASTLRTVPGFLRYGSSCLTYAI